MTKLSTIPLHCSHFPLCSGCDFQGDVSYPSAAQELKEFLNSIDPTLLFPLHHQEFTGWRTRAKLAVRGTYQHPEIGLFKRGSHEVVPIPDCPLHHPSINAVLSKILNLICEKKIEPYNEEKGTGLLRYLQFAVDRKSRRVQLTLVLNKPSSDPLLERFVKQLYTQAEFHSIWFNFQPAQTNRILGDGWQLLQGEPYLTERLGQVDCCFHPACFSQANPLLFEKLIHSLRENILPQKRVIELYAGIGVIGFNIAEKSDRVTCVELNPFASEGFHLTRLKSPCALQKKISFHTASVDERLDLLSGQDVIIVDPPRKGLGEKIVNAILSSNAQQLIYVSCGPRSFQKECSQLLKGGWKIDKVEGYLFFPGSNHVELMAIFKKESG